MSKQIKKIAPNALIKGNSKPPRSGAFEVSLNEKLIYSKFETGEFPQEQDIKSWFNYIRDIGRLLVECTKHPAYIYFDVYHE